MAVRHRSAGAVELGGLDAVAALRHGRRVSRLSQRDLARRAYVSQSLIARIESRRVDPPVGLMQRLLGLCGLRWELRLAVAGDTAAAVSRRRRAITDSSRQRQQALFLRKTAEFRVARETAERVADERLTVRERRARVRQARLAERAAQVAALAAVVNAHDRRARRWTARDTAQSRQRFERALAHCRTPLPQRLPTLTDPERSAQLHALLDALAHSPIAPCALTGWLAGAVWGPGSLAPSTAPAVLAAVGWPGSAEAFLAAVGASRRPHSGVFDFGPLTIRLRSRPPLSTSLVCWRPRGPELSLAVTRPEIIATDDKHVSVDRHTIRAVLQSAGRDARGRRRPPYLEAREGAASARWLSWVDASAFGAT